jgi:hypothetical protein
MSTEPKKRGRKPKPKTDTVIENDNTQSQSVILEEGSVLENVEPVNKQTGIIIVDDDEQTGPKKRGRKPKPKDPNAVVMTSKKNLNDKKEATIVINKFLDDSKSGETAFNDNTIVHLQIPVEKVDNIINNSNNSFQAFDNNVSNWYSSIDDNNKTGNESLSYNEDVNQKLENLIESRKNDFDISKSKTNEIRRPVDYTMLQFKECNKKKIWPQRTNIYCFNCAHSFDHAPAALPFKYQNGIFHVYGCFCYPECAAAFNFNESICVENSHENYNLLNLMYRKVYNDPNYRVKIASHRTCLKIFGGNLDIDKYRASFNNPYMNHHIIMPPVISIIPLQEENNIIYYKKNVQTTIHNNNKGYDGAYKNKDKDYTLKRSKPIINKQNTLENCMNIFVEPTPS